MFLLRGPLTESRMFGTVSNLMLYTFDLMVMLQGIGHSALCLKLINQLTAIGAEALTSQLTRVYFFRSLPSLRLWEKGFQRRSVSQNALVLISLDLGQRECKRFTPNRQSGIDDQKGEVAG